MLLGNTLNNQPIKFNTKYGLIFVHTTYRDSYKINVELKTRLLGLNTQIPWTYLYASTKISLVGNHIMHLPNTQHTIITCYFKWHCKTSLVCQDGFHPVMSSGKYL